MSFGARLRLRVVALVPIVATALLFLVGAAVDRDWALAVLALMTFGMARLAWVMPGTAGWLLILFAPVGFFAVALGGPESTFYSILLLAWFAGTPAVSGLLLVIGTRRAGRPGEGERSSLPHRIRRRVAAALGVTVGTLLGAALGIFCGAWAGLIVLWVGGGSGFSEELGFLIVLPLCVIGCAYLGGKGFLQIPRLIRALRQAACSFAGQVRHRALG
jgi:hypothetical protein